jgi:DNA polymerase III delta prime subunit
MNDLVLHPITSSNIEQFISKPSHALLITGGSGSGKLHTAEYLAAQLLNCEQANLSKQPYFAHIQPDNGSTSIDAIRELQKLLVLKVPGKQLIRRVIIIEDAHLMTTEAQNALLKALEEPPLDTVLILLTPNPKQLLPTITSRLQTVNILPVSQKTLIKTFGDTPETKKAILLSGGKAGLFKALLENQEHPLLAQIDQAKQYLRKSSFERQQTITTQDREEIQLFLQALLLVCEAALKASTVKRNKSEVKRWHERCNTILEAQDMLDKNAQIKLLLTNLALQM